MELGLCHLFKAFRPKTVLRDLSLTARSGYCVVVLGRNGAGKSTLFNLLTNGLLPNRGEMLLDGVALGETFLVAVKRSMGALVNQAYLVEELRPSSICASWPASTSCPTRRLAPTACWITCSKITPPCAPGRWRRSSLA